MKKYFLYLVIATIILAATSCKKFLDLKPIDSPTEGTFYVDEKGLQAGVVSIYDGLQSTALYGNNFLTMAELRADNLTDNNPGAGGGVRYQLDVFSETPANTTLSETWLGFYTTIYRANVILEKAPAINMDATRKNQIIGQALFLRALSYFNLTRLWGKVPLITKIQSSEEARANKRADTVAIYAQILNDLTTAIPKLPATWVDAERGRITSNAATALLGKVYLYQKNYLLAASTLQPLATAIYAGTTLALVPQTITFPNTLKTSKDIIFGVQYLLGGIGEAALQVNRYQNNSNNNVIALSPTLFEATDNRKTLVAPAASGLRPGKFNTPQINNETSSDFPIIRCADVLLMYAEALNENAYPDVEALKALNAVRTNAVASLKSFILLPSQASFRAAVYNERNIELALECDRWFDIIRTNQFTTLFPLVPVYRQLYPVPQVEIDNVTDKTGWQNTGY
ncbi:MAG: RagB/SusD family nutrient uptake outer membrane protein [Ferruginibacter sp.]|nr:RagB/SusD family nutrient uptake outer membrane protein [Ferruginibacter sp.]